MQLSQLPGYIVSLLTLFFILEKTGQQNLEILGSPLVEEPVRDLLTCKFGQNSAAGFSRLVLMRLILD